MILTETRSRRKETHPPLHVPTQLSASETIDGLNSMREPSPGVHSPLSSGYYKIQSVWMERPVLSLSRPRSRPFWVSSHIGPEGEREFFLWFLWSRSFPRGSPFYIPTYPLGSRYQFLRARSSFWAVTSLHLYVTQMASILIFHVKMHPMNLITGCPSPRVNRSLPSLVDAWIKRRKYPDEEPPPQQCKGLSQGS